MNNREIIEQIFLLKNILTKAGNKEIFFENNLTVANYEILRIIEKEKAETISEIKKFSSESLASLTQKIKKLEDCDCVRKEKKKNDTRKNILEITGNGKKTLKRIEKKIELVGSTVFLKYSKEEKDIFTRMLKDLENKLKKVVND